SGCLEYPPAAALRAGSLFHRRTFVFRTAGGDARPWRPRVSRQPHLVCRSGRGSPGIGGDYLRFVRRADLIRNEPDHSIAGMTRSGGLWPSTNERMFTITFSPMSMRPSMVAEPICGN